MDRLIDRIQDARVDQAILFGHGHCLRALTMVWLGLELVAGAQFELHTGTICTCRRSGTAAPWSCGTLPSTAPLRPDIPTCQRRQSL